MKTVLSVPIAIVVALWFLALAFVEVVILGKNGSIETEGDE